VTEDDKTRANFYKALVENPHDHDTRKVFGDWLEERGWDDEAQFHRRYVRSSTRAIERMTALAEQVASLPGAPYYTYEQFMEKLEDIRTGGAGDISIGYTDPDYDPEEMWNDYEIITGKSMESSKRSWDIFTCSC
jgi:uncharacterized protein (TIGR02996 family)